jgi:plasmid stabilization system protein ParE
LRYSARAQAQLIAISDYIRERSPAGAARVGDAIREAAELLRYFPHAGRPGRSEGTREWVVRGVPYIIVYEVAVATNTVVVLGVFHGAQRRE